MAITRAGFFGALTGAVGGAILGYRTGQDLGYERGYIRTDRGLFWDKGNQVFDVRHPDFAGGAKVDGATDESAAWAAAVAALTAAGGGVLYLCPGNHYVDSDAFNGSAAVTLSGVKGRVEIRGSEGTKVTVGGTSSVGVLWLRNCANVHVRGIEFVGNNVATSDGLAGSAVYVDNFAATGEMADVMVRGCKFSNFRGAGWVRVTTPVAQTVRRVRIQDNVFTGGGDRGPSSIGTAANQIYINPGLGDIREIMISGNICEASEVKNGITLLGSSSGLIRYAVVSGNHIKNPGKTNEATVEGSYGISCYNIAERLVIANNVIQDCHDCGMYLLSCRGSVIEGNVIEGQDETNDGTLLRAGIAISGGPASITGNTVKDCYFGISAQADDDPTGGHAITGNTLMGCNNAIALHGNPDGETGGFSVTGNLIEGAMTIGIDTFRSGANAVTDIVVAGNSVRGSGLALGNAADAQKHNRLSVTGNTFETSGTHCVRLASSNILGLTFTGNTVRGGTTYGVFIENVIGGLIANNLVDGAGTAATATTGAFRLSGAKCGFWSNIVTNLPPGAEKIVATAVEDLARDTPTFTAAQGTLVQFAYAAASGSIGYVNVDGATTWKSWGSIAA